MVKKRYDVKTYFQGDEVSREDRIADYFFQVMYVTVLPSLCLLMAVQLKDFWFFSLVFWFGFVALALLQLRVRIV